MWFRKKAVYADVVAAVRTALKEQMRGSHVQAKVMHLSEIPDDAAVLKMVSEIMGGAMQRSSGPVGDVLERLLAKLEGMQADMSFDVFQKEILAMSALEQTLLVATFQLAEEELEVHAITVRQLLAELRRKGLDSRSADEVIAQLGLPRLSEAELSASPLAKRLARSESASRDG